MLQGLTVKVTRAYKNFEFYEVFHSLYNFCVINMSSFYLDVLKDRLYTFRADSRERKAAQWVLYKTLVALTKLMAPMLSFTAEEIWRFIPGITEKSVFFEGFPAVESEFSDSPLEKKWDSLLKIRDEVNKALELKRQEKFIGNSLEAKVTLYVNDENYNILKDYRAYLPTLFIVSSAEVLKGATSPDESHRGQTFDGLAITIEKAEGKKCSRCWNWRITTGKYEGFPDLCDRCYEVLQS
jgi:isoleucyl-tRNA synthetase